MEIQTMSIVVGGPACNAKCPYCISKMTGLSEVKGYKAQNINERNLSIALSHAKIGNVTTLLFTSKGEPTIYPGEMTTWLDNIANWEDLNNHKFPYKELQTNGIAIANGSVENDTLELWYSLGLTTISISVVGYSQSLNQRIFTPDGEYFSLGMVIDKLKKLGFNVRINCTLIKDGVDSVDKAYSIISSFFILGANQITFRPMRTPVPNATPTKSQKEIYNWAKENVPNETFLKELECDLNKNHEKIMTLAHGAAVYDVNGMAVCLSDCLTKAPEDTKLLRQLILYTDGRLTYDWQYKAAQLLPPNSYD